MIKKKIEIVILTLILVISTTGLPTYFHYCMMMNQQSLSECEMCKSEIEKIETSCCSEKVSDNSVIIKSEKAACCQTEFVYNKVEDNFLSNKTEANIYFSFNNLFEQISLLQPTIDFQSINSFYCDSSPPFLVNSEIYITNLALLI